MDKSYNHTKEANIYELWQNSEAFTPKINKKKKPFTIIMPPPNASDPLHIGHAREVATQDLLIRFHRMKGAPTLWLPGADHAGIETQFVFEKKLKAQGKSRFDFDSKTLYKMIWQDTQKNRKLMENQLKKLGASCDWTRSKFTLDPEIVEVVYETFKSLYDDGLIYRGEQLVNYCPRCGTNYSELEVEHKDKLGVMYYLDYGNVKIATTRPETIFADVAVAVNPKDSRYKNLIGKSATIPFINRKIPIIADRLVDTEFGTGALKITPAHDKLDFDIGQKHNLPILSVIDQSGAMINTPKEFVGLSVNQARRKVVQELTQAGLIVKTETINHTVGTCYRCSGLIEPTISKQWFLKVSPLTQKALKAISKKDVRFVDDKYRKIAVHWLKNLNDWNISRQIAWGIPIPAWQCQECREWTITSGKKPDNCPRCKSKELVQDPDTFDTWFSSGQWPYATLMTTSPGDFKYFYPTSVMDPSYDILPFWVIRMIMLGLYKTGQVPFRDVLLHGLVRDKNGLKISKSKGNVVDPIEMIDKYGADALRVALIWGARVENDNSLSEENIRAQRNLGNKLWNISRFMLLGNTTPKYKSRAPKTLHKDDKKIIIELRKTAKSIASDIEKYRLNEGAKTLYDFIWNQLGNDYLEKTKSRKTKSQPILEYVVQETLKMAHPFLPFTSESIWQNTFGENSNHKLLITESWPKS